MLIIAGQRRGALLTAPRGMDTRPTQAKVRESLFSMIQAYVPNARVLDLFAGSGALALEAISRGAASAVLVDRDREAAACIRRNIEKLRFGPVATLYCSDWRQALSQMRAAHEPPFDLVFLDPPYRLLELAHCCQALAEMRLLNGEALLVLEHRTEVPISLDERFALVKQRAYGETELHLYQYQPDAKGE